MSLFINATGIRPKEKIKGIGKQCKGTTILIDGFYPPSKKWVQELSDVTVRDELSNYPFFRSMDTATRRRWLLEHSNNVNELYLDDVDINVTFLTVGGEYFMKYPEISNSLIGKTYTIKQVFNMFPSKPGSRAKKHTLVFRPSNWTLIAEETHTNFQGLVVDLDAITITNGGEPTYVIDNIGFKTKTNSASNYRQIAKSFINSSELEAKYEEIMKAISFFTPSWHKSCIQKIIRTRADYVIIDQSYNSALVLLASITLLLESPGSFVPNIQRYVTGLESAFKRVAVSICEDSSFEEGSSLITMFLAVSLIIQHHSDFKPGDILVYWLYYGAIVALETNKYYAYRTMKPTSPSIFWQTSAILLKSIGSFESDIIMLQNIDGTTIEGFNKRYTMPIYHILDHHVLTEIAYYLNVDKFIQQGDTNYANVFKDLWERSSKYNPRYHDHEINNQDISKGQEALYNAIAKPQQSLNVLDYQTLFDYRLDPSWLAGIIGSIEVKHGNNTYIVCLRTDLSSLVTIRKPRREDKDIKPLDDDEKYQVESQVLSMLEQGITVTFPDIIPYVGTVTVKLIDGEYHILDGQDTLWDEYINLTYALPLHSTEPLDPTKYYGYGVRINHKDFLSIVDTTDIHVLRRACIYLKSRSNEIHLHKISRDGTGVEYAVSLLDTKVFQLLCTICNFYPGALTLIQGKYFKVSNGPLFYTIADHILYKVQGITEITRWPLIPGDHRKLREYQEDSVKELIASNNRGSIVWIEVGMGKTLILMTYMKYLIEHNKLPEYVVYTLPTSAIDSIKKELTMFGFPFVEIDMRKSPSPNTYNILQPLHVNLVPHDHMRRNGLDEQLRSLASKTFFVCDEFHLCLNSNTIRTSLALEIAKLAREFVAMSGTILNSADGLTDLIAWLELVVPFNVNIHNYYVAVGSLISKKVQTNVEIIRQDIDVTMTPTQLQLYKQLVPIKLGGTASRINLIEAVKICYEAITPLMVEQAVTLIQQGYTIFMVAKDIAHQDSIYNLALRYLRPEQIFLITRDNPITLTPDYQGPIKLIVTTIKHSSGYTLTKANVMITSVYFSNEATREQLEGRINRIGQTNAITILTYHTGVLSYILEHYKKSRNMSQALKGFAKEVGDF